MIVMVSQYIQLPNSLLVKSSENNNSFNIQIVKLN